MTTKIKPMLAAALKNMEDLSFSHPWLATPKLDGIRCLMIDGKAVTRSLKPIRNDYIRNQLESQLKDFPILDGEIMIPAVPFTEISSAVMRREGEHPTFEYHIFDTFDSEFPEHNYYGRMLKLGGYVLPGFAEKVLPTQCDTRFELIKLELEYLNAGYEGIMLRHPYGPYKFGRSTLKEEYLLKLKRFEDAEAVIIGFEELMVNNNEKTTNELGHSERSTHQANLSPGNTLGALIVMTPKGVQFKIGTGYSGEERQVLWDLREDLVGTFVTYVSQPTGVKDKPRFPVFKGLRHKDDLGE